MGVKNSNLANRHSTRGNSPGETPQTRYAEAKAEKFAFLRKLRQQRREKEKAEREAGKKPPPVTVRVMGIDDASHIIDSWCRSFRRSATVGPVEPDVFKIEQRSRIDRLICRSQVLICSDAVDTTRIRGWVCFEAPRGERAIPVVHYVCVHPEHQQLGIGTALVGLVRRLAQDPETFLWCTHDTAPMRHIRPKWNLLYNPYLLEIDSRQDTKYGN